MTISIHDVGAAAQGTTSVAPAYPAVSAGDYLLYVGAMKPDGVNADAASQTGWGYLIDSSGGAGSAGADSGQVTVEAYGKIAEGTESGTFSPAFQGTPNSILADILSISCGAGKTFEGTGYSLSNQSVSYGSDNTAGTSFSVAFVDAIDLEVGDLLVVIASTNTDARTYSAHGITASGITFSARTVHRSAVTANGNDCALEIFSATVTAGSGSVAPTATMTASGTTANQNAGAAVIIRLREVDATPDAVLGPDLLNWFAADSANLDVGPPLTWHSVSGAGNDIVRDDGSPARVLLPDGAHYALDMSATDGPGLSSASIGYSDSLPSEIILFANVYVSTAGHTPIFVVDGPGKSFDIECTSGVFTLIYDDGINRWRVDTSTLAEGWYAIRCHIGATSGTTKVFVDGVDSGTYTLDNGSHAVPDISNDIDYDTYYVVTDIGPDFGAIASLGIAAKTSGSFAAWQLDALDAYQAALLVSPNTDYMLSMSESITKASDAVTRAFTGARGKSESATAPTDAVARQTARGRSQSESVTKASDACSRSTTIARSKGESAIAPTDAVTRAFVGGRAIATNMAAPTDANSRALTQVRAIPQSLSAPTDAVTRLLVHARGTSESIAIPTDANSHGTINSSTMSENIAKPTDANTRSISLVRLQAESLTIPSDAVVRATSRGRSQSETIAKPTDAVARLSILARIPVEALAKPTDANSRSLIEARVTGESLLAPTDGISSKVTFTRAQLESLLAPADAASRSLALVRGLTEATAKPTDAFAHLRTVARAIAESVPRPDDVAIGGRSQGRSINESVARPKDVVTVSVVFLIRYAKLHCSVEPAIYMWLEQAMGPIYVNATHLLKVELKSIIDDEELADPTDLTLHLKAPDGTPSSYSFSANPDVVRRTSKGVYRAEIVPTQVGPWRYWWTSDGPAAAGAGKGDFDVDDVAT